MGKNIIFSVLLFLNRIKDLFLHLYYLRRQHGSFLGAEEAEPERSGAMADIREAVASVPAEANTGMRRRPSEARLVALHVVFCHCEVGKPTSLLPLYKETRVQPFL